MNDGVSELEEYTKSISGLGITMWSPNVTYSKNDIVLYYKQESKQISPDVGKRDFVFMLIS